MSLCVRRLRGVHGCGARWRNGIRAAGGGAVTARVREEPRIRGIGWPPELSPCSFYQASLRSPLPLKTIAIPLLRPRNVRICPSLNGRGRNQRQRQPLFEQQRMRCLSPKQLSNPLSCSGPEGESPVGRENWHLSSAQLECFRSLFEPGVCRVPYQAFSLPTYGTQHGVLAFHPSKNVGTSPVPGGNQSDMEQQLSLMHAKLSEELPNFLRRSLDYSVYRKDVEFVSTFLHLHTRGIILYQLLLTLSRFMFLVYFSNASVSVLKITSHPETCSIQARWAVSGLPLHTLLFHFYRTDKAELYRSYDAHSTFYLASDGLIHLHKVDRVMPSQPLTLPKKTILAAALVALGLGENRPALNLLSSPKPSPKL